MMLLPVFFAVFLVKAAFGFEIDFALPDIPNPIQEIFQNKCITHLGCFYTGPPFYHPIHRPISLTPSDDINTKFQIFTQKGEQKSLDSNLPTKVLIHGYLTDMDEDDIRYKMKDAYLNNSDYNVVVVDWSENNKPPYAQAIANARAVAVQVANFLKDNNFDPKKTHIIGHSLGGQMAGWIGERIPNLARITGLDPAGPFFQNADNPVRLDRNDATFVDVIHSDAGESLLTGLGLEDPIGDVDFYPNGGKHQPGCARTINMNTTTAAVVNATTQFLARVCDHTRALDYFMESLTNKNCRFLAVKCDSYSDFEKGKCSPENSDVLEMGENTKSTNSDNKENKYFLRTNGEEPFCLEDSIHL